MEVAVDFALAMDVSFMWIEVRRWTFSAGVRRCTRMMIGGATAADEAPSTVLINASRADVVPALRDPPHAVFS
jgi:hypothetical protein